MILPGLDVPENITDYYVLCNLYQLNDTLKTAKAMYGEW